MTDGSGKLSERQGRFAKLFVALGSAAEAARQAGYSEKTARSNTGRLLKNPEVRRAIEYFRTELALPTIADMREINAFWTQIIRDPQQRMQDRLKAAELRAKVAGGFDEKPELKDGIHVTLDARLEEWSQ